MPQQAQVVAFMNTPHTQGAAELVSLSVCYGKKDMVLVQVVLFQHDQGILGDESQQLDFFHFWGNGFLLKFRRSPWFFKFFCISVMKFWTQKGQCRLPTYLSLLLPRISRSSQIRGYQQQQHLRSFRRQQEEQRLGQNHQASLWPACSCNVVIP